MNNFQLRERWERDGAKAKADREGRKEDGREDDGGGRGGVSSSWQQSERSISGGHGVWKCSGARRDFVRRKNPKRNP